MHLHKHICISFRNFSLPPLSVRVSSCSIAASILNLIAMRRRSDRPIRIRFYDRFKYSGLLYLCILLYPTDTGLRINDQHGCTHAHRRHTFLIVRFRSPTEGCWTTLKAIFRIIQILSGAPFIDAMPNDRIHFIEAACIDHLIFCIVSWIVP